MSQNTKVIIEDAINAHIPIDEANSISTPNQKKKYPAKNIQDIFDGALFGGVDAPIAKKTITTPSIKGVAFSTSPSPIMPHLQTIPTPPNYKNISGSDLSKRRGRPRSKQFKSPRSQLGSSIPSGAQQHQRPAKLGLDLIAFTKLSKSGSTSLVIPFSQKDIEDFKNMEKGVQISPNPIAEKCLYKKGGDVARQIMAELETAMPKMAKNHLEKLTHQIRTYYVKRYVHSKNLKYGNLNKGFTEKELQAFFYAIDNDEFRLLFEYMANLGFRIGEAVRIRLDNINLDTREIKLRSEKSGKLDSLIIPIQLFQETLQYINSYREEIAGNQGYLFFSDKEYSKREEPWIEKNYVRKKFREYVRRAGLDETYGISDEREGGRAVRTLHRLTTHSLRHFAISRFSRKTNGNLVLTSRFARHANPNTTMIYIHSDKKEIYDVMDAISTSELVAKSSEIR